MTAATSPRMLGDKAKYLSYATAGLLIVLSFRFYSGWLLFAMLVVLLGLTHPTPLNDISGPGPRAKAMGAAALVVFAVTFVPTPMMLVSPDHSFDVIVEDSNITVAPGGVAEFNISLVNTGNVDSEITITLEGNLWPWSGSVAAGGEPTSPPMAVDLAYNSTVHVKVLRWSPMTSGETSRRDAQGSGPASWWRGLMSSSREQAAKAFCSNDLIGRRASGGRGSGTTPLLRPQNPGYGGSPGVQLIDRLLPGARQRP